MFVFVKQSRLPDVGVQHHLETRREQCRSEFDALSPMYYATCQLSVAMPVWPCSTIYCVFYLPPFTHDTCFKYVRNDYAVECATNTYPSRPTKPTMYGYQLNSCRRLNHLLLFQKHSGRNPSLISADPHKS